MRVTYNHYYGAQEKFDLTCFKAELDCDPEEEATALANGWLWHNNSWYQSRSTRIKIQDYQNRYQSSDTSVRFTTERANIQSYENIYKGFCDRRGFIRHYDPFFRCQRDIWMEYRHHNNLIGFTKLQSYNQGLESQFCAYLSDPDYHHGLIMLDAEVRYAMTQGLSYLYIGSGYERSSIYKAHIMGFEWWTGAEWSEDNSAYIRLCERDSDIRDMVDLARIAGQA